MTENATLIPLDDRTQSRIGLSTEEPAAFCRKNGITSMALFGSVLRVDFGSDSDVDFLVTFSPIAYQGLLAQIGMKFDLEEPVHRSVDLVVRQSVEQSENWIRREAILSTAQIIYDER
ncbi:MAG: nucleotidyltransferase domain-containing protein [Cyanobacteria bacterium J06614_10]